MVELKNVEIRKGAGRYIITVPKALVDDSDVLKLDRKYRVLIEAVNELRGLRLLDHSLFTRQVAAW